MTSMHPNDDGRPPGFWRSRHAAGFLVIGAVAAYYLLTEHLAHVLGALPYLLLLVCPVMHIFMHRGHGHGHGHGNRRPASSGPERPEEGQ
ncbi:DUF2933 domain-containing protein [Methyloversatilis discipulorum]|uniref:DUF2933 domain-containing protein n=2 Tax=Sterolibacteriaceae TaxID=2008793 RepID=UPI0003762AFA